MTSLLELPRPRAPRLSDEQRLLQRTLADLVPRLPDGAKGWRQLAELELLSLPFAIEDGGSGGGGLDLMVVMQEMGRSLVRTPYLAGVVLGGISVRESPPSRLRAEVLRDIARGESILALAYLEPGAGHDPTRIATTADETREGYRLLGQKTTVIGGQFADAFVVSARTIGGPALFLVDAATEGVRRREYSTIDSYSAADLELDGVEVARERMLCGPVDGFLKLERALVYGAACLAAEAVGAMEEMLNLTVEHLRSREQFRRPLSTFQVLRHRVVEMYVAVEQCRSAALAACASLDRGEAAWRASAAKALVGRYGRFVGQQGVQLHGGMGLSVEHKVCHYFARLTAIDALLGDARWHLQRL